MFEKQETNPNETGKNSVGPIFQLLIVIAVAFVLATLFTAWTPGVISGNQQGNQIVAKIPQPTPPTPTVGATATKRLKPLIGIVSGHWGNDSGATCSDGLTEAEVNQTIATLVQKDLIKLGYDVDLLKEFDTKLAGYQASALVSIHADSCEFINNEATGFKVATALARSNRESSTRLAACIRNRYAKVTNLPNHSTSLTADMTSYHAFNEIDIDTPAAIIETGFLNLDRQLLTEHPDLVAKGIVEGILCFLNNESISPTPNSNTQ
jgi:N-acetylmuramoyl-L-alanine amidase